MRNEMLGFVVKSVGLAVAAYALSRLTTYSAEAIKAETDDVKRAAMMTHNDMHDFSRSMNDVAIEALPDHVAQTYNSSQQAVRNERLNQHALSIDGHKHS